MLVVLFQQLWKPGVLLLCVNQLYRPIYVSNVFMEVHPHGVMYKTIQSFIWILSDKPPGQQVCNFIFNSQDMNNLQVDILFRNFHHNVSGYSCKC